MATGSFLKRNPGVPEGFRFCPVKQETFFKDDANHDPQWSDEQIISANFEFNGLKIGELDWGADKIGWLGVSAHCILFVHHQRHFVIGPDQSITKIASK